MDAEACLLFLDTNILLYAHDRSAGPKFETAKKLVEELWQTEQGCLSLQVLQEFYINVTQKIPHPLDRMTARQLVSDLGHWRIHIPQVGDVLQAIDLQRAHSLSFWDAMIIQSALSAGCRRLVTEDLTHGQTFAGLVVTNPFLTSRP
jgi:predicted nucleic acid-binding protein